MQLFEKKCCVPELDVQHYILQKCKNPIFLLNFLPLKQLFLAKNTKYVIFVHH